MFQISLETQGITDIMGISIKERLHCKQHLENNCSLYYGESGIEMLFYVGPVFKTAFIIIVINSRLESQCYMTMTQPSDLWLSFSLIETYSETMTVCIPVSIACLRGCLHPDFPSTCTF